MTYRPITKHLPIIRKIPNELRDEIKILLPQEKSNKTIGRLVIPFRRALSDFLLTPAVFYE